MRGSAPKGWNTRDSGYRTRGGGGARYGPPAGGEPPYPGGDDPPDPARGHFDFAGWDPHPVGEHPAGRSAWGIDDLVGNGWEWTSTVFAPLPGLTPLASAHEDSAP